MAPDLNSLPPSPSPLSAASTLHARNRQLYCSVDGSLTALPSPPSHSPSSSLPATIFLYPNMQNPSSSPRLRDLNPSPRVERRRSSVLRDWNDGGPSSPGLPDLQRQRAPSLGELHQELENEQEAQVNRLLSMIRQQHIQLQQLQSLQAAAATPSTTTVTEDGTSGPGIHTPVSDRSASATPAPLPPHPTYPPHPRSYSPVPRTSTSSISRQSSQRHPSSRTASPLLHPTPGGAAGAAAASLASSYGADAHEWSLLGTPASSSYGRDEVAFYQAETQSVLRENAMLKNRIRELERMLGDAGGGSGSGSGGGSSAGQEG